MLRSVVLGNLLCVELGACGVVYSKYSGLVVLCTASTVGLWCCVQQVQWACGVVYSK